MSEILNWGICDVSPYENRYEQILNSASIDPDLKEELLEIIKQIETDNNNLLSRLNKGRMEIDRMKETIVRLAMMLGNNQEG